MTKKTLSAIIILIISISISDVSCAMISDIGHHWAKNDIVYLSERGIIHSYSDKTFKPDRNITRGELKAAINNLFRYTGASCIGLIDADNGYYNDRITNPNEFITREEASKLIALACGLDKELPNSIYVFSDAHDISKETIVYVSLLNERGYMSGFEDGTFQPKRKITRGEASAILAKVTKDIEVFDGHYISEEKPIQGNVKKYSVQIGVYGSLKLASKQKELLIKHGFEDTVIVKYQGTSKYYVMAGSHLTELEANNLKSKISAKGHEGYITSKLVDESNIVSGRRQEDNSSKIVEKPQYKVSPQQKITNKDYCVQTGIYSKREISLKQRDKLIVAGFPNAFVVYDKGNSNYCVMADAHLSKKEAEVLKNRLITKKFEAYITMKLI